MKEITTWKIWQGHYFVDQYNKHACPYETGEMWKQHLAEGLVRPHRHSYQHRILTAKENNKSSNQLYFSSRTFLFICLMYSKESFFFFYGLRHQGVMWCTTELVQCIVEIVMEHLQKPLERSAKCVLVFVLFLMDTNRINYVSLIRNRTLNSSRWPFDYLKWDSRMKKELKKKCHVYAISVLKWGRFYAPIKINNYVIYIYPKLLCNTFLCPIRLRFYPLFSKTEN